MKNRLALLLVLFLILGSLSAVFAETASEPLQVDLDLSKMSGTIVYAQIYNIQYDPGAYLGKVIRVRGYYSFFREPSNGHLYYACVIPDATACCSAGIEFVWEGEHAWPEDYPEIGTDIVVTGRLEIYQEDGYDYLHLLDAKLETVAEPD